MNEKWVIEGENKEPYRFGDYFKVSNSVATLYNQAFLFESDRVDEHFYYVKNGKVEKELVFDAVSTKSEKKFRKNRRRDKIIFPYRIMDQKVESFTEDEFKKSYPECYLYLEKKKDNLKERKSSKGIQWFEYGRTQALNSFFGDKLIMSMVITNGVKTYRTGNKTIPYAGAYIQVIPGSGKTLDEAKNILESEAFNAYVKKCGTPTTTSSYRISVKDVENYRF